MVNFNASREEIRMMAKIAERAVKMAQQYGVEYKQSDALMDLDACHSNGCQLKLDELLAADDGNFLHDVFGIRRHIDRTTGKLGDCFLPRYSA